MEIKISNLPKSEIELKIEVPVKEWQEFLIRATKELSKDLKIEGFRPGQAPISLVEKKIGMAKILETASENCIKESYVKAILDNNIEAIGQPEIFILKLAKNSVFEFKAKTAIMPEANLPDYKKIASKIKKNKVLIEEKEIEETLLRIQKSRAKFSLKSGPCQKGDWVKIKSEIKNSSLVGSSDYKQKSKISETEDAFILGEGHLIPGIEEKLEGMKEGEEKEFSLVFPENHFQKNLAGQKVDFKIKLKLVQNMELPEINDQFARNLGNFENLDALKKSIKQGIYLEKEKEESWRVRQNILEKISQDSEVEIPEILVNRTKEQMLEGLKQYVSQNLRIAFEDYLDKIKKTEKELLDSFSTESKKRVKNSLILKEISKKENIEVLDEEIKAEIDKILKNYPDTKRLDLGKLKDYTEEVIRNEKVLAMLESFAITNY